MKWFFLSILVATATCCFTSCGNENTPKQQTKEETKEEEHADEHEHPNTATLTPEQINSIGIVTGNIEHKQLTSSLKANGTLLVPNQNKATVNSLYSGVIRSLRVQPGNVVRKGQVIATVANPQFIETQSQYISTNTKINQAQLEVTRQKELNAGNAGSLRNLQNAETELRTLQTTRSTLEQQIKLMGIDPLKLSNGNLISQLVITSPINGTISNVMAKMGSYIDVTTPVAEIVDNSQLHLDLFIYEKDLPKVKNNQTIHFTLTNNPGKEYDAEIFSLGSSFEGEAKAVSVHARVIGDKTGLIDGMNITALVSLDKITVPAVPADAIVTYQGQDYIFIQTNAHTETANGITFEKIPVAKGTTDVGYTEITLLKEIPANTKVVVKNAFFVLAKMTNAGDSHEH